MPRNSMHRCGILVSPRSQSGLRMLWKYSQSLGEVLDPVVERPSRLR